MIDLNRIYQGDCIEVMKTWPANFVDTIITDPPYGIGFMGKEWDRFDPEMIKRCTVGYNTKDVPEGLDPRITKPVDSPALYAGLYDQSLEGHRQFQSWCCAWATEALRIAKPGAMMLVSGGTRTFHRMTAGLEDAGWQIRDCLMWLYGSGFPKSHNLHGEFQGWGTALKPAWEPIILAMKPIDGTFAENAERWGVAGLNVDGGRIDSAVQDSERRTSPCGEGVIFAGGHPNGGERHNSKGRWPANLILDEEAAGMLDGVSGHIPPSARPLSAGHSYDAKRGRAYSDHLGQVHSSLHNDSGGASRFFYVAKSSRAERNEGCEGMADTQTTDGCLRSNPDSARKYQANSAPRKNHHPTVKPLELMKYLCQLTRTPTGGIVLDPFAGSGTTLWAAEFHNRPWIGIEMNPEYVAIAEARIARERAQMKMAI